MDTQQLYTKCHTGCLIFLSYAYCFPKRFLAMPALKFCTRTSEEKLKCVALWLFTSQQHFEAGKPSDNNKTVPSSDLSGPEESSLAPGTWGRVLHWELFLSQRRASPLPGQHGHQYSRHPDSAFKNPRFPLTFLFWPKPAADAFPYSASLTPSPKCIL